MLAGAGKCSDACSDAQMLRCSDACLASVELLSAETSGKTDFGSKASDINKSARKNCCPSFIFYQTLNNTSRCYSSSVLTR